MMIGRALLRRGAKKEQFMESRGQSSAYQVSSSDRAQNDSGLLFSGGSVLNILKLILAGSPLPEVLAIIAQLVESRGDGTLCTIWLPEGDGKQIYCATSPGIPGFGEQVGSMRVGPKADPAAQRSIGGSLSM